MVFVISIPPNINLLFKDKNSLIKSKHKYYLEAGFNE